MLITLILLLGLAGSRGWGQERAAAYWCSEGNFSNDHGHMSYVDANGTLHEDVLNIPVNEGKKPGITLQYATFYNGKIYAVSKQRYGSANNQLVRINPATWEIEKMGSGSTFDGISSENRIFHFLGVSNSVGYLSSSDSKLYRVDLENLTASLVKKRGWYRLKNREVGTMVLYRGRIVVEVYGEKTGNSANVLGHELWVLNVEDGAEIEKFSDQGLFNPIVTKDGRLLAVRVVKDNANAKHYSLVQLNIDAPGTTPIELLQFSDTMRPADFQTQTWSWSQGYVFASTRENKLYWNVESGLWDMHSIAMLDMDATPLTPKIIYTGNHKFYGITRENPHDGALWVNFNGSYGVNDTLVRLTRDGARGLYAADATYTLAGSYYFSSCPFFEDLHAAEAKDSEPIPVAVGSRVDLCDKVEDADGFRASVLFCNPAVVSGDGWSVTLSDKHLLDVTAVGSGSATITVDAWSCGRSSQISFTLAPGGVRSVNTVVKDKRFKTRGAGNTTEYIYIYDSEKEAPGPGIEVHVFSLKDVEKDADGQIVKASIDKELADGDVFDPEKGVYARVDILDGYAANYSLKKLDIVNPDGIKEVKRAKEVRMPDELSKKNQKPDVKAFQEYFYIGVEHGGDNCIAVVTGNPFDEDENFTEASDAKVTLAQIEQKYSEEGYFWTLRSSEESHWQFLSGVAFSPSKKSTFIAEVYDINGKNKHTVNYRVIGELDKAEEKVDSSVKFTPKESVIVSVEFNSVASKYTLSYTDPAEGTITVQRSGVKLESGEKTLVAGEELVITAAPKDAAKHELESLKVNGADFTSGGKYKVSGDVTVEAKFKEKAVVPVLYTLSYTGPAEGTITVLRGGTKLKSGDNTLKEGDALVITAAPKDAAKHELESLKVNGAPFESGATFTVSAEDVKVEATFKPVVYTTLTISQTGEGMLKVLRGNEELMNGEKLRKGDKLVIEAKPNSSDYKLATLNVNGTPFASGSTYTVGDQNVRVEVVFDKSTAVESVLLAGVAATPNPCGARLTLRGASAVVQWEVYTVQGQLVARGVSAGEGEIEIATAGWIPGVYYVRLEAADGVRVLPVVKE